MLARLRLSRVHRCSRPIADRARHACKLPSLPNRSARFACHLVAPQPPTHPLRLPALLRSTTNPPGSSAQRAHRSTTFELVRGACPCQLYSARPPLHQAALHHTPPLHLPALLRALTAPPGSSHVCAALRNVRCTCARNRPSRSDQASIYTAYKRKSRDTRRPQPHNFIGEWQWRALVARQTRTQRDPGRATCGGEQM